ncbi:hypothetical protein EDB83DRAFT_2312375 [Lactarius deliciosus]|nr:hypothetical protein EDB83DRAFT_2312375 [Lactarius deliciosus]
MRGQAVLLATAVVRPCRVGVVTGLVVLRRGLWVSRQGFWRGMGWGGHSGAWVATRHLQCWGDSVAWGGDEQKKKNNKNKNKDSLKESRAVAEAKLVVILRVATAWGGIWSSRGENLRGSNKRRRRGDVACDMGKVRVGLFIRMEQIGGRETNREPIASLNVRLSDNVCV